MEFRALGPLEVLDDEGLVLTVGGRMQRTLLAVLLIHVNEAVSVDRIVDALWPDESPVDPESTVNTYVSRLRSATATSVVETMPHGYRIRLGRDEFDVTRCEDLVLAGRGAASQGDHSAAAELLAEALGLWRGRPYDDVGYEHSVQVEVERLEELRLAALEDRIDADLNLGHHAGLVQELQGLVRGYPLRERFCGQLMVALYRAGRQAEALRAFQQTRSVLIDELGVEPSPALQALELRILEHDPHLGAGEVINTGPHGQTTALATGERAPDTEAHLVMGDERIPLIRAVTTIGRVPERSVVVDDVKVSRRHAEIRRTTSGFLLVDLGSTNGTYVNGEEVAQSELAEGDEIRIGETVIRFGRDS